MRVLLTSLLPCDSTLLFLSVYNVLAGLSLCPRGRTCCKWNDLLALRLIIVLCIKQWSPLTLQCSVLVLQQEWKMTYIFPHRFEPLECVMSNVWFVASFPTPCELLCQRVSDEMLLFYGLFQVWSVRYWQTLIYFEVLKRSQHVSYFTLNRKRSRSQSVRKQAAFSLYHV